MTLLERVVQTCDPFLVCMFRSLARCDVPVRLILHCCPGSELDILDSFEADLLRSLEMGKRPVDLTACPKKKHQSNNNDLFHFSLHQQHDRLERDPHPHRFSSYKRLPTSLSP